MKHYDLTGTKIIESIDTPWVYCNDNMTAEEKQMSVDDWYDWMNDVLTIIQEETNVVHIEDYLK